MVSAAFIWWQEQDYEIRKSTPQCCTLGRYVWPWVLVEWLLELRRAAQQNGVDCELSDQLLGQVQSPSSRFSPSALAIASLLLALRRD